MIDELVFATLDVFVYQLRNGWGDGKAELSQNHHNFWENLPDEVKVDSKKEADAQNPEYIKLLELLETNIKEKYHIITENTFDFKESQDNYQLEGYYYPVRIGDTYGLLFDCSVDILSRLQSPVSCFQTLKKLAENKQGNIGKTWIASGYLPDTIKPEDGETIENIARAAAEALMPGEWQKPEQIGKFLGATVFELWKPPQKWQDKNSYHILLIVYPNQKSMQAAAEFYGDWLRLLCYRHKIIWEYLYAQNEKNSLHEKSSFIIDEVKKVKDLSNSNQNLSAEQLQELQKSLQNSIEVFSTYIDKISNIEILNIALKTNLHNYQNRLNKIVNKANALQPGNTDLKLLQTFSEVVENKYQVQVAQDYASLKAKLRVLENLTSTIRGIVEIKQAELHAKIEDRDRTFQTTIEVAGVGFATAAIVAASIAPFMEKITQPPSSNQPIAPTPTVNPWLNVALTLGGSIIPGLLASLILFCWLKKKRSPNLS